MLNSLQPVARNLRGAHPTHPHPVITAPPGAQSPSFHPAPAMHVTAAAPSRLIIASRESRLAMWQSGYVRDRLRALYPDCDVQIEGMTTRGDQILDRSLSKVGGKGLFVKELEQALLSGRCDLAVHSLKDVPMLLGDEFRLAAILAREDARDALVSNRYASLAAMPAGARVGTSSLRREAQLRARHPRLAVLPLRGNVITRLAKLDQGEFDGIILAAAGLKRLGLAQRIAAMIDVADSLPAPGQGALAIEVRADRVDLASWLLPLHDAKSAACVEAERAVSRSLGGSCQVPLAAYACLHDGQIDLRALVARQDGSLVLSAKARGPASAAEALGIAVGQDLIGQGALAMLAAGGS